MDYITNIVGVTAGLLLSTLSNWLYDIGRSHGLFPDRPGWRHVLRVPLIAVPLIILNTLPQLIAGNVRVEPSPLAIRIIAICITVLLLAWTVYVFRARRASNLYPALLRPRFERLTRLATAAALAIAIGLSAWSFWPAPPSNQVIVLVADFAGPDPERYRVTDTVLNSLITALQPYSDTTVLPLGRPITEAEGSAVARAEGQAHDATIVIWGWYGTTDPLPLSVHFEVLRPPPYLPDLGPVGQGTPRRVPLVELESFSLQVELSTQLSCVTLLVIGLSNYAAGDLAAAGAAFTDALPASTGLAQALAHFYRGVVHQGQGNLDAAITDYSKAIEINPNFAEAYFNRGIAHGGRGELDDAITDYGKAIEIRPNYADAYFNRGTTRLQQGNLEAAITDFDKAIEIKPDYAQAYFNRGLAHYHQGDDARAITDFDEVIRLVPLHAEAYLSRGMAHDRQGSLDPAKDDYSSYLKLRPDAPDRAAIERRIAELEAQIKAQQDQPDQQ